MKNRPVLSIAPYYGGKGRMAHFIADRLNYDDSDIFVTPFGGMCRVLLNKPRHSMECYNDYSSGLTTLMSILSDPNRSTKLIHRLCEETDHSQAEFDKQKVIFDNAEIDLEMQEKEKLRRLLIDNEIAEPYIAKKFMTEILGDSLNDSSVKEKDNSNKSYIKDSYAKLQGKLKIDSDFKEEFQQLLANWIQLYQQKENQEIIERPADRGEWVSDMDLAIATYVVFQQSRDGMGQTWSAEKFKTNQHYKNQIVKLFDCAERLAVFEIAILLVAQNTRALIKICVIFHSLTSIFV